ncbi:MAG TPA: 16S rRNA (adenine(1518)-N(6)/adenine(1519)-N(6))-dimethyltransferase RsmA [Patescibacteria group bacterium]|jgi:16S rRNA (adenine1518-N6/adenine1519-N6)-dimethyltransferase|nr:16S rRNA (adenine(1518)-N(6)/adenine(1519)-N(6))-dimethyltransferase RsmA [Patescibacteria group bacterium]
MSDNQVYPKKSLGQHWLNDRASLQAICDAADLQPDDVVLEIGPGLGSLTTELVSRVKKVVAVEFDPFIAANLPSRVAANNLEVIHGDILKFDLSQLPRDYKVVANLPYYITSKITRWLLESANPPKLATLLVQKEVAERMAAEPGQLSILGIATQFYTEPQLGIIVPPKLFTPPPQVDSQVITLVRRQQPLFKDVDVELYFKVVKAGFSEKRKKLRSSLSGSLQISKAQADELLQKAGMSLESRAQELSLDDWYKLEEAFKTNHLS